MQRPAGGQRGRKRDGRRHSQPPPRCRRWLREASWEGERALWQEVCDTCRIVLTPGKDCHAAEPGFFRLCYAWMPLESLPLAVARIAALQR